MDEQPVYLEPEYPPMEYAPSASVAPLTRGVPLEPGDVIEVDAPSTEGDTLVEPKKVGGTNYQTLPNLSQGFLNYQHLYSRQLTKKRLQRAYCN